MRYYILFLAFFLSDISISQNAPVSYKELLAYSKKQIKESFSEGDRISLVATEVVLAEFDKERPDKVLEVKCTLKNYDGTEIIYSTVHRQLFKASEDGENLDNGFFLLRDISLEGIENIKLQIGVRSLNNEQSKLFNIVSNIISSATENNPAIQSVRELINTKGSVEESIPVFDATFFVPNNFINYQAVKIENQKLALLSTTVENTITFKDVSVNVPKSKLKRFANLILGNNIIEEKEDVGGVLILKATKSTPKPISKPVVEKLDEIYKAFRNMQIDNIPTLINNAYSTLDIVYSDESSRSTSAYQNAAFYLSLTKSYLKYLNSGSGNPELATFYNSFYQWVVDKINYIAVEDYSSISLKEIYPRFADDPSDKIRVVDFYVPNNLPNEYLIQAFYMQYQMHLNFKGDNLKDKIKYFTYLN